MLVRPLTSDLELMSRAIADAEAGGATALYDSLMYSLVELRGLPGRKALVILTHGGDQESQFNPRQCADFAQRSGIPVYVIALAGLRDAAQFKDLSALRRIARITGGGYFFIKKVGELSGTYDDIARDLRSQYVFAFQPDPPAGKGRGKGAWRPLTLEALGPGLEVRTAGGYFLAVE